MGVNKIYLSFPFRLSIVWSSLGSSYYQNASGRAALTKPNKSSNPFLSSEDYVF